MAQNNCFRCKVERKTRENLNLSECFSYLHNQIYENRVDFKYLSYLIGIAVFTVFKKICIECISWRYASGKDFFRILFSFSFSFFKNDLFVVLALTIIYGRFVKAIV